MTAKGCFVPILLAGVMGCQLFRPSAFAPKATVSGGAWLVTKTGDTELLRGLDVYLCQKTVGDAIDREGAKIDAENMREFDEATENFKRAIRPGASQDDLVNSLARTRRIRLDSFSRWADLLKGMESVVKAQAIRAVKTDIDAKYEFDEVPAGSYVLFATFKFDFATGCWVLPFEVRGPGPVRINFENSNLTTSTETKLGPWMIATPPTTIPLMWRPEFAKTPSQNPAKPGLQ